MALPKELRTCSIADLEAIKRYVVVRLERIQQYGDEDLGVIQAKNDIKDLDDRIAYLQQRAFRVKDDKNGK